MEFNKFIDSCRMVNNGLISREKFLKILKQITIKKYIPITKKNSIVRKAIISNNIKIIDDNDNIDKACNLELIYLFNFLMAYTDITKIKVSADNYDTIYASGAYKYIIDICGEDYFRLVDIFKISCNIDDVLAIKVLMENVNTSSLEKTISKFSKALENKKDIENLAKILAFNDPALNKIKNTIMDDKYKKIKKGEKK